MHRRRAFTIVELLTAISVLAILSTLAIVGFNRSRQSARDSQRRADLSTYATGMGLYHTYSGTYFVTADATCTAPSLSTASCTGVGGESYGQINASGSQAGVTYASTNSIAQVLKTKGFISAIGHDPIKSASGEQLDYVLVRCASDGTQSFTTQNDGYALWTKLESTIDSTAAQYTNSSHFCGGSTSNATTVNRYNFGYSSNDSGIFPSPEFAKDYEAKNAYYALGDGAFASSGSGNPSGNTTPDFTLSAAPATQSVAQGSTASYNIAVTALNGFTDLTNLSYSGLPANTTASFNPASITGGGTATFKVVTTSTTPLGNATITISGKSGALIHTTAVGLIVTASSGNTNPDFTLSALPVTQSVAQGSAVSYVATLGVVNGFNGVTNLTYAGLPANTTASFSPSSVTGSGTSTLIITTSNSTPVGTATLTLTGTSGALIHTTTVDLVVTAGTGSSNPDFTIGTAPASATVTRGATATFTTTIGALNGFTGVTNLTFAGLPAGTTASFTPSAITGAGTSSFKVVTTGSTPTGVSTITITGTSGVLIHTSIVSLTVNAPISCIPCFLGGKP